MIQIAKEEGIVLPLLLFGLFSLAFLDLGNAYGQYYTTHKEELALITERANRRLGPLRISTRIQFRDIGYDGNIYYEREEDNPVSDYTATISPQINIHLLYRDWLIFSFMENPEYVFYAKEKRERSFNNSFSPSLRLFLFQRFVLSGNYQFRKARLRASSEFDLRADEEVEGYNGSIYYETPRGTSIGFSGAIRKLSYEDIMMRGEEIYLSRNLNREERSGHFELNYRVFSESLFFAKLGYSEYDFQHLESRWRDSYSYQAIAGLRLPYSGKIRGFVSLGYKMFIPRRIWIDSFQGLIANMGVEYRVGRFIFRLQGTRDSSFSYEMNNIFFLENGFQTGVSYYLTKFLRLDYNYEYRHLDYPRLIPVWYSDGRYEEIKRKDLYHSHMAGFLLRIERNTGVGLMINSWERKSTYFWEGLRKRWFVGAYITQDF